MTYLFAPYAGKDVDIHLRRQRYSYYTFYCYQRDTNIRETSQVTGKAGNSNFSTHYELLLKYRNNTQDCTVTHSNDMVENVE